MPLDHEWIEAHIPHQGYMCLLDAVVTWDADRIACRISSHRALDNPLRTAGRLGVSCGIEYAAQTMAVHGALVASWGNEPAPRGFLASVRDVALHVGRLDEIAADLIASACRIASDHNAAQYEFSVTGGDAVLLTGRAIIVFNVLQTPGRT